MKKLLSLCAAVCCMSLAFAGNTITYKAGAKFEPTTNSCLETGDYGFGAKLVSHEFSDSVGTMTFDGEIDSIGYYAFENASIESITLPQSVKVICDFAFYGCTNLSELILPDSVVEIGLGAFQDCSALTVLTIPNKVTSLAYTFSGCSNLEVVVLPDSLQDVGAFTFMNCSKLDSIVCMTDHVPSCVPFMVFDGIDENAKVYVRAELVEDFYPSSGWRDLTIVPRTIITYTADSKLTEVQSALANGFHTNAFGAPMASHEFADGVGTITFDSIVQYMGYHAFSDCAITSIDLPATLDSIGDYAFSQCKKLPTIDLPENLTSLGIGVFQGSGLESFAFPKRIKRVRQSMFHSCMSLKSVAFNDSITAIGPTAFWGAALDSISIPNNVKTIGESAFASCRNLASIALPDSLIIVEESLFEGCSKLASITLPESVKAIENNAFTECDSIKSIFIPKNVETIEPYAFVLMPNVIVITVDTANTYFDSRNNCNAIVETATNKLVAGCKTTVIPESVTALEEAAFATCAIDSIVIPKNVASVGELSFAECANLKTAYCLADSVPTAFEASFDGIDEEATLYVLNSELVEQYRNADGWSTFKYILPLETPTPTAVENASVVDLYAENGRIVCEGEFRIYDMLGRDVTRMNGTLNGVYVVTCGDKATKIVVK